MHEDGEHVEEERVEPKPLATITIIVLNVLVYLGQRYLIQRFANGREVEDNYFALSLDGMKRGWLWQLITFQFMHASVMHIAFNMWAVYIFGRIIELSAGWKEFLKIYFLSGVVGGLTQVAGVWLLPSLLEDAAIVGASAGASGLVAAFAVMYPKQVLYLLLVVIPVKMRSVTLMWFTIAMSVVGIFYPLIRQVFPPINSLLGSVFGNVAHAAHLGGTLTGLVLAKWFMKGLRLRTPAPPIIKATATPLNAKVVPD